MTERSSSEADSVRAERLRRQGLAEPVASARGYPKLARGLQPLSTGPTDRPGSPPRLVHRTLFDDRAAADRLRRRRELVKGRFQDGGVGYVFADDLELYANCFCRPLARRNEVQTSVLAALQSAGPLSARQLREETGLLAKQVMPALHRLQTAILVYEDQLDDDWERAWYDFGSEWPGVEIAPGRREAATREVLVRFVRAHVFATAQQVRDWSRLPSRDVARTLEGLVADGTLGVRDVAGLGTGYALTEDARLPAGAPERSVRVLHRGDYLVRSHQGELAARFAEREVLQYLLIDGRLQGAICGHWGFKPYDVDDIALDLPTRERSARRDEILAAVAGAYPEPRHRVLRYAGRRLG